MNGAPADSEIGLDDILAEAGPADPGPVEAEPVEAEPVEAGPAVAGPAAGSQIPIRVRGAQLPELGLIDSGPDTYLSPAADANRWKLRSFQLDVEAARRAIAEIPEPGEPGQHVRRNGEEA